MLVPANLAFYLIFNHNLIMILKISINAVLIAIKGLMSMGLKVDVNLSLQL